MSKYAEAIAKQEAVVIAAQQKLEDLRKAADAALLTAEVGPGYHVSFRIGRADTRREVVGIVRGRGVVKDVDSVRAEVGEGFDLEVYTVPVSLLLSIVKPGELAQEPSAAAVLMGLDAAGVSEADQLLADLNG